MVVLLSVWCMLTKARSFLGIFSALHNELKVLLTASVVVSNSWDHLSLLHPTTGKQAHISTLTF